MPVSLWRRERACAFVMFGERVVLVLTSVVVVRKDIVAD